MKYAKQALDDFFEIPICIAEDLAHNFADGLEHLFLEYTTFASSCGMNQHPLSIFCFHLCFTCLKETIFKIIFLKCVFNKKEIDPDSRPFKMDNFLVVCRHKLHFI